MKTLTLAAALTLAGMLLWAPAAHAQAGAVRLAAEGGVSSLGRSSDPRLWGLGGGFSAAIGIADLLWLQLHLDRSVFFDRDPEIGVATWGAGVRYDLDLGRLQPFAELSLCGLQIFLPPTAGVPPLPTVVPELGAGFNVDIAYGLWAGAVVRYYAIFDTDLGAPGYANFTLQFGARFALAGGKDLK